jgi:hypothetical protein
MWCGGDIVNGARSAGGAPLIAGRSCLRPLLIRAASQPLERNWDQAPGAAASCRRIREDWLIVFG